MTEGLNPTVRELDELVEAIFAQKKKIEEMEAAVSVENSTLASMEQKAVSYLLELERDKYQHPKGTLFIEEKWRFSLPKTDEAKAEFFSYLRERGLYDKYATVHATAYNSFCNAEWQIAQEEGRGFDFKLPGVPEPTLFRKLSTRKR